MLYIYHTWPYIKGFPCQKNPPTLNTPVPYTLRFPSQKYPHLQQRGISLPKHTTHVESPVPYTQKIFLPKTSTPATAHVKYPFNRILRASKISQPKISTPATAWDFPAKTYQPRWMLLCRILWDFPAKNFHTCNSVEESSSIHLWTSSRVPSPRRSAISGGFVWKRVSAGVTEFGVGAVRVKRETHYV